MLNLDNNASDTREPRIHASEGNSPSSQAQERVSVEEVSQKVAPFFAAWRHWSSLGRASRSEYWFGVLQLIVFWAMVCLVGTLVHLRIIRPSPYLVLLSVASNTLVFYLWAVWTSRRFHDMGKTVFLPVSVAGIVMLMIVMPFIALSIPRQGAYMMDSFMVAAKYGVSALVLIASIICIKSSEPRGNEYGCVPYIKD